MPPRSRRSLVYLYSIAWIVSWTPVRPAPFDAVRAERVEARTASPLHTLRVENAERAGLEEDLRTALTGGLEEPQRQDHRRIPGPQRGSQIPPAQLQVLRQDLLRARDEDGYTEKAIAHATGVSHSAVTQIMRGKIGASRWLQAQILEGLNELRRTPPVRHTRHGRLIAPEEQEALRQKLDALYQAGHLKKVIAKEAKVSESKLDQILAGEGKVTAPTQQRLLDAVVRLQPQPPLPRQHGVMSAEELKTLRDSLQAAYQKGYRQSELAKVTGAHQTEMSRILRGVGSVRPRTHQRIMATLDTLQALPPLPSGVAHRTRRRREAHELPIDGIISRSRNATVNEIEGYWVDVGVVPKPDAWLRTDQIVRHGNPTARDPEAAGLGQGTLLSRSGELVRVRFGGQVYTLNWRTASLAVFVPTASWLGQQIDAAVRRSRLRRALQQTIQFGYSRAAIAREAGVNSSQISDILQGKAHVSKERAQHLLTVLAQLRRRPPPAQKFRSISPPDLEPCATRCSARSRPGIQKPSWPGARRCIPTPSTTFFGKQPEPADGWSNAS